MMCAFPFVRNLAYAGKTIVLAGAILGSASYSQPVVPVETANECELCLASDVKCDCDILIRVLESKAEVKEMSLRDYLSGVLRAEMSDSFEEEALKAQAVAARTYTMRQIQSGKHGQTADICTDHTCCQAFAFSQGAKESWNNNAKDKIERAVISTERQVILYDGELIDAIFHSSSAGMTRRADRVWQTNIPYLQPVSSPENEDSVPNYHSRAEFTCKEFKDKIHSGYPEANLKGNPETWIQNARRDESGSVITLDVGGVSMKGSTLRGLLGLRSACFNWSLKDDHFTFDVTGYGHGVGMSQYGANAMAKAGADYREILTHYYTGVMIGSIQERGILP